MSLYNKTLQKDSSIPLYYQLKKILLTEIHNGNYAEATPLPPEMELAKKFHISRPTVRQAICSLVSEGILTRTKGKGTYVVPPKIEQDFSYQLNHYNSELATDGTLPPTQLLALNKISANQALAKNLKITTDSQVFELIRLRFNQGEPNMLITSYIPTEIYPRMLERDFTKESLYQVFAAINLVIKKIERIVSVTMPTPDDCKLLNISPAIPLLYFTTTAYSDNQVPIEYSFTKYRGDKNKFSVELNR